MLKSFVSAMLLLAAIAVMPTSAADPPVVLKDAGVEKLLRDLMHIPADMKLVYRDEKGATLTEEEFARRMQEGRQLDVAKDAAAKTAVVSLSAKSAMQIAAERMTQLPAFELNSLTGRRIRNPDLAGRPALINFFFEECVPCIKEAPVLSAFRRKHPEFNFLAITADSREQAARFVKQRGLDWPVAFEAGAFVEDMKVTAFPTYALVAADGRILGRGSGMDVKLLDDPVGALAELETWVKSHLNP